MIGVYGLCVDLYQRDAVWRLSKTCCVRVLLVAENEAVGRPVQNFVSFFKIIEIRLIQYTLFFYTEPTSRPSSKSSLFIDINSADCSTKSSLIVP